MELIPSWAPNVHPMIVHFPIVLVTLAVAMDLVHLLRPGGRKSQGASTLLYLLAAVSAVVAYLSGRAAADTVFTPGGAYGLVEDHRTWALVAAVALGAVAALRLSVWWVVKLQTTAARALYVFLGLVVALLILQTAERGARLVYEQGVGVIPGSSTSGSLDDSGVGGPPRNATSAPSASVRERRALQDDF